MAPPYNNVLSKEFVNSEMKELEKQNRDAAHRELEVSLAHYADLYDYAPVGYLCLDASGNVRNCNLVASRLLGIRREALQGRPLLALISKADRMGLLDHLAQLRRGKSPVITELTFMARRGPALILQLFSVVARTVPGARTEFRTALLDITEQRVSQEDLRQSNKMLQAIVMASPLAVIVVNHGLKVQVWNPAAERLFGWTSREVVGKPLLIIPRHLLGSFQRLMHNELRGRSIVGHEVQRLRKDGTFIDVSFSSAPLFDHRGRLTSIVRIYEDITQRKRSATQLRQASETLEDRVHARTSELAESNQRLRLEIAERLQAEAAKQESEIRFQAVLDNSPSIIFVKDTKGRYLHCNHQFEQILRVPLTEALGKTDAQLFLPTQAAAFQANDEQVLLAGRALQFEEMALHEDGLHTSIVSKFPLIDPRGHVYGIAGMVTDVTQRKRLEAEVLHVGELERQRIGHDLHDGLCQLLAGIRWKCQSLQEDLAAKDATAGRRLGKLTTLLSQAVEQARAVAHGLQPIEKTPEGLMVALHQLAGLTSELFGVRCACELPRPIRVKDHSVATDLFRIAQEAVNNAIKHGKARKVQVKLTRNRRHLVLKVTSDGKSFPERPHSDGLGLKTMNYRSLRMGAELRIGPRPGIVGPNRGAVVLCSLPLSKVASNGECSK